MLTIAYEDIVAPEMNSPEVRAHLSKLLTPFEEFPDPNYVLAVMRASAILNRALAVSPKDFVEVNAATYNLTKATVIPSARPERLN